MVELTGAHVDAIVYYVRRCQGFEEQQNDGNRTNEEQMKLKSFAEEGLRLLEDLPSVIASREGPMAKTQLVKTVNVLGALDHHGDAIGDTQLQAAANDLPEFTENDLTLDAVRAAVSADDSLALVDLEYFVDKYEAAKQNLARTRTQLVLGLQAAKITQAVRRDQPPIPPAHGNDI